MKKSILHSIVLGGMVLCFGFTAQAQGVAVNDSGNPPDPSAILDVTSTTQGVLMPRMTTNERDAIASPALGLIIFNTDCNALNMYNGNSWIALANNSGISSPGMVSGTPTPCLNSSGVSYSVASVPNATGYNWTVPQGVTIASGQGTNSVLLDFTTTGGNICVNASDACGYSSPSCIAVTILTAPSAPSASAGGNATKTSFDANWSSAATATTYYLDVATDALFTNLVAGYSNLNVGNVTTYPVSGLTCGTTYYYRLRAGNSCGTSASSSSITMSTLPCCSNEWNQLANFGGGSRYKSIGFSIGTKAYMGTGINSSGYPVSDFWEYDPSTNVWTQKASFSGGSRYGAIAFAIGSKGYAGTGINSSGYGVSDFWEYDPAGNTWTSKASFGGGSRYYATGFASGAKGYVGTGINSSGYGVSDFWEYDPSGDTWTSKAGFGGGSRYSAVGFAIGTKGYLGTGINSSGYGVSDFWEYDFANNSWTSKASFTGGSRYNAVGFAIGSKGYAGTGINSSGYPVSDFWEYNPTSDSWVSKVSYTGGSVYSACGFSINSKGYLGTGINSSGYPVQTFYEFCP